MFLFIDLLPHNTLLVALLSSFHALLNNAKIMIQSYRLIGPMELVPCLKFFELHDQLKYHQRQLHR